MKNLLYISFLITVFLSYKNSKEIGFSKENMITQKTDTLIKISEPFKINGIECYWTYSIITDGGRIMKLKDYQTNRVLLDYSGYRAYFDWDYKPEDYFDEFNKENFKDVNFDGFKDFVFQNIGNTPMNSSVGIHLFDNKTKTFEEFIDNDYSIPQNLIEIDSINKKLITGNEFRYGTDSIIHCFDKKGKVQFAEVYTNYSINLDSMWVECKDYKKIINGNIVIQKNERDTIR